MEKNTEFALKVKNIREMKKPPSKKHIELQKKIENVRKVYFVK